MIKLPLTCKPKLNVWYIYDGDGVVGLIADGGQAQFICDACNSFVPTHSDIKETINAKSRRITGPAAKAVHNLFAGFARQRPHQA